MNIKLIKSEEDYQTALKRLGVIFDAKSGTIESDEADILGLMMQFNWPLHILAKWNDLVLQYA